MLQALFDHYGARLAFDNRELSCFWAPEQLNRVTEQDLRALKVGYRARSIQLVSDAFIQKQIDEFNLRSASREVQRQQHARPVGTQHDHRNAAMAYTRSASAPAARMCPRPAEATSAPTARRGGTPPDRARKRRKP